MERLCVLIYETSEPIKKTLRDLLVAFSIGQDVEVVIKWLKKPILLQAVEAAAAEAQIAFVNADDPATGVAIGRQIYATVPDCSLIYYGNQAPASVQAAVDFFTRLYPARPIRYLTAPSRQEFDKVLRETAPEAVDQKRFCWENKGMRYRIPLKSILYFRSDRNHVHIHLINGVEYPFVAKLTDVERRLPDTAFVRVHQSYLVNADQIDILDKSNKTVILSNGEEIFISKAHYKDALSV